MIAEQAPNLNILGASFFSRNEADCRNSVVIVVGALDDGDVHAVCSHSLAQALPPFKVTLTTRPQLRRFSIYGTPMSRSLIVIYVFISSTIFLENKLPFIWQRLGNASDEEIASVDICTPYISPRVVTLVVLSSFPGPLCIHVFRVLKIMFSLELHTRSYGSSRTSTSPR
jgi:hypothetical protein